MTKIAEPIDVKVYLDGDLNAGFLRLKKATSELLEELSVHSKAEINVQFINPSIAESSEKREQKYAELQARGMTPTAVYERDKEGKTIEKIIFPWIEVHYKERVILVNLLKNIRGNSGEENLNISIESLEFEITDAIRQLTITEVNKIAFIEGHGELSEQETFDISVVLSKYYQVDRGVLANDASVLDGYKVIIIAKPTESFSESDKYIIDQYVMNGGRVLWLIDGVKIAKDNLSTTGMSPAMELDINLGDMLFRYGVRINPVLLQDAQCVSVPMNIAPANAEPQFELVPWFYAPLLLTSYTHPISRNLMEVKSEFASSLEVVSESPELSANLLLATSDNTHIVRTPIIIDLGNMPDVTQSDYFNVSYVPVAVLLEGVFQSVFTNRIKPKELINIRTPRKESMKTKQLIIADGDIIRNEVSGGNVVPLGFDRYMNQQFGNKDFIQNAVLYLADGDESWIDLRARTVKLSLLNKKAIVDNRTFWQLFNIVLPLAILLFAGFIYQFIRKRKYSK